MREHDTHQKCVSSITSLCNYWIKSSFKYSYTSKPRSFIYIKLQKYTMEFFSVPRPIKCRYFWRCTVEFLSVTRPMLVFWRCTVKVFSLTRPMSVFLEVYSGIPLPDTNNVGFLKVFKEAPKHAIYLFIYFLDL